MLVYWAGCFRFGQQVAVFQFLPTTGAGFRDRVVPNQIEGQRAWRAVIEQNQHYGRARGLQRCAPRIEEQLVLARV